MAVANITLKRLIASTFAICAFAIGSTGSVSQGALFPYSNDFSAGGFPNQSSTFTWDGSNQALNFSSATTTGATTSTASVQITNIGTSDFIMSSRFVLNFVLGTPTGTGTADVTTIGFGALSSASGFAGSGGESFYNADWTISANSSGAQINNLGRLRIQALGDNTGFTVTSNGDTDGESTNGSSIVNGGEYELRLTGTYVDTTLHLTLAMFDHDGNLIGTPTTATDTSPLAGQYFGLRNRLPAGSGPAPPNFQHIVNASYDDFNLTLIPEPSSLMGSLACLMGLLAATRRRAA